VKKTSDRIKKIKYQYLRELNQSNLTDENRIEMVRSILDAQISEVDYLDDISKAPATLMGVRLVWNSNGKNVIMATDSLSLSDKLTDDIVPKIQLDLITLSVYNGQLTESLLLSSGEYLQLITA